MVQWLCRHSDGEEVDDYDIMMEMNGCGLLTVDTLHSFIPGLAMEGN